MRYDPKYDKKILNKFRIKYYSGNESLNFSTKFTNIIIEYILKY